MDKKKPPMTYEELGRRGGLKTKERGPDYYRAIGKKGGEARKRQLRGGL